MIGRIRGMGSWGLGCCLDAFGGLDAYAGGDGSSELWIEVACRSGLPDVVSQFLTRGTK